VDTTTGEILAHTLTPCARHDGPELPGLLEAVEGPVEAVYGDGAYDGFDNHKAIRARGARPVIPPRHGAAITPPRDLIDPPPTRGQAVRRIAEIGRKAWKREVGYHRRSLAETAMGRYKGTNGEEIPQIKKSDREAQMLDRLAMWSDIDLTDLQMLKSGAVLPFSTRFRPATPIGPRNVSSVEAAGLLSFAIRQLQDDADGFLAGFASFVTKLGPNDDLAQAGRQYVGELLRRSGER
jgi:hypothetical protein